MRLEINITKGKFWALATLLILVIAVFVFAATNAPNPGHAKEDIEGLTDLETRVDKLEANSFDQNFCVIKKGDTCPTTMPVEGFICVDTEDSGGNKDTLGGVFESVITSGQCGDSSKGFSFCCKS